MDTSAEVLRELIIILRTDETPSPIFLLHATLMIPVVTVKPSLDDVQEVLILVGKTIAGVARGVSQWNSRINKVYVYVLKNMELPTIGSKNKLKRKVCGKMNNARRNILVVYFH